MSVYKDISSAVSAGAYRTVDDFYERAKNKFLDRLAKRKPKTEFEKNVGEAYSETPSGAKIKSEYIQKKIQEFFSNPINVLLVGVLLFFLLGFLTRR